MKTLIQPQAIKTALETLAMNGVFTAVSKITGKDFTYKVKQSEFNDKNYTHVYVENGYLEFKHIGTYFNGKIYKAFDLSSSRSASRTGRL